MATKTTEHSPKFKTVKFYYPRFWNITQVRNAVVKNWITPEEFEEITGEVYTEPTEE